MTSSDSVSGVHSPHGSSHAPVIRDWRDLGRLSLGALGVVYGDIGTSPLYALKECFASAHGVAPTLGNVLGVLSLVFWSLMLVVVVKYIGFVLRADHHGEGGILALLALVSEHRRGLRAAPPQPIRPRRMRAARSAGRSASEKNKWQRRVIDSAAPAAAAEGGGSARSQDLEVDIGPRPRGGRDRRCS